MLKGWFAAPERETEGFPAHPSLGWRPGSQEAMVRGSSVQLRRSLRLRVLAASALAFLGLSGVICLVLPHAYELQARDHLKKRAQNLALGVALMHRGPAALDGNFSLEEYSGLFVSDPQFASVSIVDAEGNAFAHWPENATTDDLRIARAATTMRMPTQIIAFHPITEGQGADFRGVVVRMSTRSLQRDLEAVRWLFASIFLFTSGVFFVLTKYLSRTILNPLEQIGRAAMNLADGEPVVNVPKTGDREIDELGAFIAKLGENRRHSRVMTSPIQLLNQLGHGSRAARNPAGGGDIPEKREEA